MPSYTVTHPQTGKSVTITGDAPPSEAELDNIFASTKDVGGGDDHNGYIHVIGNATPLGAAIGSGMSTAEAMDKGLVNNEYDLDNAKWLQKEFASKQGAEDTAKRYGVTTGDIGGVPQWGRENPNLYAFAKTVTGGEANTPNEALADFIRPTLEGGGTVLGGIGGTAVAPVAGTLAGAGLGYAAGKKLADLIQGKDAPATLTDAALGTGKDVLTGAAMEAGGQGVGKIAEKTLTGLGNAYSGLRRATPALTESGLQAKAGQVIADNTGTAPIYAQNAEEAAGVNIPGFKPSIGEARNDPGLIKLQRGIERQTGTAGNVGVEQKATNTQAVKDYLQNEFTGNESIDDVINALNAKKTQLGTATEQAQTAVDAAKGNLNPAPPQAIGGGITDAVDEAIKPVKAAEREAWAQVPNYPIPAKNLEATITDIQRTPMEADTEKAVNSLIDFAHRMPKTTEGMQSIERTINDKMYAPNADPNVKRILGQLKAAVGQDFKAMGEAADAGDIAIHNGEVIYPSKLADEATRLDARIAEEQAKSASDIQAIISVLREKGTPFMKQMGESEAAYNARMVKQYETATGQPAPVIQGSKDLSTLMERRAAIDNITANMQPAEDVAGAYRAAKDVSKERFDRFGKGVLSDITQTGNEATGLKLTDSQIARKIFSTPEAADDFIRAVGPEEAAKHADQYAAHGLLSKANPLTGEIPAKVVAAWIQKNSPLLRKYGIASKYSTVAQAQAAAEAAQAAESEFTKSAASRILNADVDKAVASAFSSNPSNTGAVVDDLMRSIGNDQQGVKGLQNAFKDFLVHNVETTARTISGDAIISPAAIQKQLAKYAPAMDRLYANEPGKIAALNRVAKAVEIQSRSAKSPLGGGSDTAENINVARSILGKVVEMVPGVNWTVKLAKLGLGKLGQLNESQLNNYIIRALYDPNYAQTLAMAAKKYMPEVVQKRVSSELMTLGLYAAKPKEQDNDPLGIRAR